MKELSQRRLWPLSKRYLTVSSETFEMHAISRLDLGKHIIKHLTPEANGKRERGQVRLLVLGDYLLRLRSMCLD